MKHLPDCPQRLAREGGAAVECEHGYDCCPLCDPCTCGDVEPTPQEIGGAQREICTCGRSTCPVCIELNQVGDDL